MQDLLFTQIHPYEFTVVNYDATFLLCRNTPLKNQLHTSSASTANSPTRFPKDEEKKSTGHNGGLNLLVSKIPHVDTQDDPENGHAEGYLG